VERDTKPDTALALEKKKARQRRHLLLAAGSFGPSAPFRLAIEEDAPRSADDGPQAGSNANRQPWRNDIQDPVAVRPANISPHSFSTMSLRSTWCVRSESRM
jgi:hypothetical protein